MRAGCPIRFGRWGGGGGEVLVGGGGGGGGMGVAMDLPLVHHEDE